MTTSVLRHLNRAPFTRAPKPSTTLRSAAGKMAEQALALLRMSAGLNSVDPELLANRIVHD